MKIKEESCTIVIVGKWNKYILSPDWVANKIFEEKTIQLEFSVNVGRPPRYTSADIRIIPSNESVLFISLNPTDANLAKMEQLAKKLLGILEYTPIQAFGINFSYVEDAAVCDLASIFNFSDNDKLSEYGCKISNSTIKRELLIKERMLNLTISQSDADILFEFNFHYDVTGSKAHEILGDKMTENKGIAEDLLHTAYGLELERTEELSE